MVRGSLLSGDFYVQKLTSAIISAGAANVVRALQLAAIRAFSRIGGNKGVMRTAHVAAGFGGTVLRDSHVATLV